MRETDSNGSTFTRVFQVKGWQLVLTLISWLVFSVMWLTNIRADANESQRRIRDLETRPVVTEQEYRAGQHTLELEMQRIYDKLDTLDNLKTIERMQQREKYH
jgi:hypothetical protein